jgi:hypothetical protein
VKLIVLFVAIAAFLTGCNSTAPGHSGEASNAGIPETKLDEWSWLSGPNKLDADLAQIPKDSDFEILIPKEDPLNSKSVGWGKINSLYNFIPTDEKSYVVLGGSLVTRIGSFEKKAKWGSWDFVYDATDKEKTAWGPDLTSGEILLPRSAFLSSPADASVENSFEIEASGSYYVLLRLDPTKHHHLCFLNVGRFQIPTVGYIGSRAEMNGQVLERKADGWYFGASRMSKPAGSTDMKHIFERGEDEPVSGSKGAGSVYVIDKSTTTRSPLYAAKNLEFPLDSVGQGGTKKKIQYIQSEGWVAYKPNLTIDKRAALVGTPNGSMIAGADMLAYKIDWEKRWGFLEWKQ